MNVLYHNNGDGGFTDVTRRRASGTRALTAFGVLFTDLDEDGWPDIFVANDSTPNFLFFTTTTNGTFSETGARRAASR